MLVILYISHEKSYASFQTRCALGRGRLCLLFFAGGTGV